MWLILLFFGSFAAFWLYGHYKDNGSNVMTAINLAVSRCQFLPIWLRVYILGVAETAVTVLWQRGIGSSRQAQEAHVDELVRDHQLRIGKRTIVVTGGDSGIGSAIVGGLLNAGFHVIVVSKTEREKCLVAHPWIDKVSWVVGDLASLQSVHSIAETIKDIIPKGQINGLINNAGIMNTPCHITADGFESQHQVNYISPMLLTILLLPWIEKENGFVLFASSSTLYATTTVDFDLARNSYEWDGLTAYAHSKLCLAEAVRALGTQLTLHKSNIKVYAYHPGTVRTSLFAHTTVFSLFFLSRLFDFIMLSIKEGSRTPLFLAFKVPSPSGCYWSNESKQTIPSVSIKDEHLKDSEVCDRIWSQTLTFCQLEPKILHECFPEEARL
ncbi:hypothetical protein J3Q64DRAFT_1733084 [Phycomyces blakesleeanus]|uniref:Uncharacterized protein n=2 Tax=Phycomyces blakesleeanus TaxID=4837 RepID=A0A163DKC4_PHYB8|nr:hypothetical protein PHYBLDRAFT_146869 [Phycomyces blakesleeanus NRRL 1555(-)]OAD71890.1 hypothetical protein PHYBLDRAFT_146869 [Phycomyces blakesleeanus NRRL 1555(-)]|eukprot:XP_018289930.1 hypothetical protein PHYBLDRAFT_146869 [Phycomyces blakesleeanus NRRL 1555(-)]